MASTAPRWLDALLAEGLAGLAALRLNGAPASDTINLTVDIWAIALMSQPWGWDEARDAARIRAGFTRLYAECDEWPAPRQLLRWLPDREPLPALAGPPPRLPPALQERVDALNAEVAAINADLACKGEPALSRADILAIATRKAGGIKPTLWGAHDC